MVELNDLAELLGLHPVADLAVLHIDALLGRTGVEVGGDTGGVHQQERAPPITDLAGVQLTGVEGNFVSLAIAVWILGLKGLHDLTQVIPGLRHRKTKLVQPGLVDHEVLTGCEEALGTARRQHGHLAIDGDELLGGRLLLEEFLHIRQLVKVIAKLLKSGRVSRGVIRVECANVQIRDFASGQRSVLLLAPLIVGDLLPLDGAIAISLKLLGPGHLTHLGLIGILDHQNGNNRLTV